MQRIFNKYRLILVLFQSINVYLENMATTKCKSKINSGDNELTYEDLL